jgi:hypothetical protein
MLSGRHTSGQPNRGVVEESFGMAESYIGELRGKKTRRPAPQIDEFNRGWKRPFAKIRIGDTGSWRAIDDSRRGFCNGNAYAKAQTNGGSTNGADQGTRCAVWAVAGENDYAALSNERYLGGDGQPG